MHVLPGIRTMKWAVALVAIVATTATTGSQSAAEGVFAADVAIRQEHVGADGQRLPGAAPAARYRIEHRAGPNALTRLTMVEFEGMLAESVAGPVAVDNPFLVARMELDHKGVRLYNRRGDRLQEVTAADRRYFGFANPPPAATPLDTGGMSARSHASNLVVAAGRRDERREELERQFGQPRGQVRGLDRYVITRDQSVQEVLVDPVTALPVEVNTVRGAVLASHVRMTHQPLGNGSFLRRSFRAERSLPDTARRIVTTIDVTNVQVAAGGAE